MLIKTQQNRMRTAFLISANSFSADPHAAAGNGADFRRARQ